MRNLDAEVIAPVGDWFNVLWCSCEGVNQDSAVFVPRLVECTADHLRARYLALVRDLSETPALDARVVDYLALRLGFSCWWMTQIAEKCNFEKSPLIDDVIQFMAFDELALGQQIDAVELVIANHALA